MINVLKKFSKTILVVPHDENFLLQIDGDSC
jgi:ATPase subunit of ABC transporter with duplicated ATPase domains